jgi:hypothetical protein
MLEIDGNHWRMTLPCKLSTPPGPDLVKAAGAQLTPDEKAKPLISVGKDYPQSKLVQIRPDTARMIEGAACVPFHDIQDEFVEPGGLVLTYFAKQGRINWHHGKTPWDIVGHPLKWIQTPQEWYLWAHIYDGLPNAEGAFKLASAGAQLAWSVEGRTLERHPKNEKRVTRALVINLALTHNPICPDTYAIASSLATKEHRNGVAEIGGSVPHAVLHKSLSTPSGAVLVPESLEDEPQEVLANHYRACVGGVCRCLDLEKGLFVGGHQGALYHFYGCCGATPELTAKLASHHIDLARETAFLLKGEG